MDKERISKLLEIVYLSAVIHAYTNKREAPDLNYDYEVMDEYKQRLFDLLEEEVGENE